MIAASILSRRDFLQQSGKAVAASSLAGITLPHVHAANSETIQHATIGCGGRGSGVIVNAMEAPGSTTKLVAMAVLYDDRLQSAHRALHNKFEQRMDVPSERQFFGFDAFNVEWTFPTGTRATHTVRYVANTQSHFATYVHGSKKAAQFCGNTHAVDVEIYKDQNTTRTNIEWRAPQEKHTVWQNQWNDFLEAIRPNKSFNQATRAAHSNLAAIMGRAAMHMGRTVRWDEALASNSQWFPAIDQLTHKSDPPVRSDATSRYPVPVPGQWTEL